jgi:prepilin-type N-terminal cleavage/methylation domain-containing protein
MTNRALHIEPRGYSLTREGRGVLTPHSSASPVSESCQSARAHNSLVQVGSRAPRKNAGFTLVEMLCAVIVLLLVSALMAVGVQLATKAYSREITHSEAQVLLSTLRTTVSDELRYAGTTEVNGSTIKFFSQTYGEGAGFSVDENGQVLLKNNKLLSKNAYPYGIKAQVNLTAYDSTSRIFTVEITVNDSDGSPLGSSSFQVKKLNESS